MRQRTKKDVQDILYVTTCTTKETDGRTDGQADTAETTATTKIDGLVASSLVSRSCRGPDGLARTMVTHNQ